MSTREQDGVLRTMQNIAHGNRTGQKLVFDEGTKTIRSVNYNDPDGHSMALGVPDMKHFAKGEDPEDSDSGGGPAGGNGTDEGPPRGEETEDDRAAASSGEAAGPRWLCGCCAAAEAAMAAQPESGTQKLRMERGQLTNGLSADTRGGETELVITASSMEHAPDRSAPVITISAEDLAARRRNGDVIPLRFRCLDEGDAFSAIGADETLGAVPGSVHVADGVDPGPSPELARREDVVFVVARAPTALVDVGGGCSAAGGRWEARGWARRGAGWQEARVVVVPVREELASRTRGLLETAILADKRVFTAGVGSGAAPIVMELAKLGVSQILMDHDRVEVGNVVRHVAVLGDVGRYKVNVMAERARGKNPYTTVETSKEKITWDAEELVADFVGRSDLVVCGVDDDDARVILNKVCVRLNTPLIVAGAFRRAYGGHVLFVKPGLTPCYQCFLHALPEQARDQEISSEEQAERIAYSDRPVAIEPGLSNDIAPISTMVVKLAIQHLIQGHPTTLSSLDEDLVAPWYLWLNRREKETDFAELEPLEFNVDGMHVLRWYGIDLGRNDACPCCGDFVRLAAQQEGLELTSEDTGAFAASEEA